MFIRFLCVSEKSHVLVHKAGASTATAFRRCMMISTSDRADRIQHFALSNRHRNADTLLILMTRDCNVVDCSIGEKGSWVLVSERAARSHEIGLMMVPALKIFRRERIEAIVAVESVGLARRQVKYCDGCFEWYRFSLLTDIGLTLVIDIDLDRQSWCLDVKTAYGQAVRHLIVEARKGLAVWVVGGCVLAVASHV